MATTDYKSSWVPFPPPEVLAEPEFIKELEGAFDCIDDRPLLKRLRAYRWTGRPGYRLEAMWRAFMSSYLRNLKNLSCLIRELQDNRDFRRFCGFGNTLPCKMTFYRFHHRLVGHWKYVRQMFVQLTDEAKERFPDLGDQVVIDSTFVRAYGNPNRKSWIDPDAKWGYKNDARAFKGAKQRAYGYKMHTLSDANHGLPLTTITIPANRHDSTQLKPLVTLSESLYSWFKPSMLIGDKAYDGREISSFLIDKRINPIIGIKKTTAHDGMYNGIYGRDGTPHLHRQRPNGVCPYRPNNRPPSFQVCRLSAQKLRARRHTPL